ncbi:hypothetical protein EHQ46_02385 [Leptospira yanagawae]|uniref:Lipoprotein n=1 Tax=Leptospira yanagawae TaxID=293069 RepID=A0ABY2M5W0_9LEPT|nr:hypothetical protein [Leptospira yanagawae]TGL23999.1 hypothetical protein EHQ46_02385 [Leptospira yanagawae]
MKSKILFYITFATFLNVSACKEKDWREDPKFQNQEQNTKLLDSQKIILSKKKEKYVLVRGYKSKNEAIEKFFSEIKTNQIPINAFISWDEQLEIIFPNTYGLGTTLDHTPLDEYQKLLSSREAVAIESIYSMISSGFKIESIDWESPRRLGQIIGHKPKVIIITKKGKFEITQIKMVYDIEGKFIVGVLGP